MSACTSTTRIGPTSHSECLYAPLIVTNVELKVVEFLAEDVNLETGKLKATAHLKEYEAPSFDFGNSFRSSNLMTTGRSSKTTMDYSRNGRYLSFRRSTWRVSSKALKSKKPGAIT